MHETIVERNVTEGLLKDLSEEEKQQKAKYEELTREVHKWRGNLEKAIDDIPTGWNRVLQDFVSGLGDALSDGVRTITSSVAQLTGAPRTGTGYI